jgi:hypothetical protein
MKALLIVVVFSFVVIEADERWMQNYGPGNGRGRNGNIRGLPWEYPQQIANNIFTSDVEWVCQNPRTNDIVIYIHIYTYIYIYIYISCI